VREKLGGHLETRQDQPTEVRELSGQKKKKEEFAITILSLPKVCLESTAGIKVYVYINE